MMQRHVKMSLYAAEARLARKEEQKRGMSGEGVKKNRERRGLPR